MKTMIIGMPELDRVLKNIPGAAKAAVHSELKTIAMDLQGKSQELAPVDTGDLQGSAFNEVEGLDATIGFVEPYALKVHEDMQARHKSPGQSKYLETPYKENVDKYIDMISVAVKKAVDK